MLTIPEYISLPSWVILAALVYLGYLHLFNRVWARIWGVFKVKPEGYVYLMRRGDGFYKIGQTVDLRDRQQQLSRQHNQPFYLVAKWEVPNLDTYEAKALELTQKYAIDRTEHRAMTRKEALIFVFMFTQIVRG